MKQIIGSIQPFAFEQKIYVFEDGRLLVSAVAHMDDFAERVVKMANADEVEEITLQGSIDFTAKIKERIREYEVANYGEKKLEITLVS